MPSVDDRWKSVDAAVDDLQASLEACCRTAEQLRASMSDRFAPLPPLLRRSLLRDLKALLACASEQSPVIQDLRQLLKELRGSPNVRRAVRPAPVLAVAARRAAKRMR